MHRSSSSRSCSPHRGRSSHPADADADEIYPPLSECDGGGGGRRRVAFRPPGPLQHKFGNKPRPRSALAPTEEEAALAAGLRACGCPHSPTPRMTGSRAWGGSIQSPAGADAGAGLDNAAAGRPRSAVPTALRRQYVSSAHTRSSSCKYGNNIDDGDEALEVCLAVVQGEEQGCGRPGSSVHPAGVAPKATAVVGRAVREQGSTQVSIHLCSPAAPVGLGPAKAPGATQQQHSVHVAVSPPQRASCCACCCTCNSDEVVVVRQQQQQQQQQQKQQQEQQQQQVSSPAKVPVHRRHVPLPAAAPPPQRPPWQQPSSRPTLNVPSASNPEAGTGGGSGGGILDDAKAAADADAAAAARTPAAGSAASPGVGALRREVRGAKVPAATSGAAAAQDGAAEEVEVEVTSPRPVPPRLSAGAGTAAAQRELHALAGEVRRRERSFQQLLAELERIAGKCSQLTKATSSTAAKCSQLSKQSTNAATGGGGAGGSSDVARVAAAAAGAASQQPPPRSEHTTHRFGSGSVGGSGSGTRSGNTAIGEAGGEEWSWEGLAQFERKIREQQQRVSRRGQLCMRRLDCTCAALHACASQFPLHPAPGCSWWSRGCWQRAISSGDCCDWNKGAGLQDDCGERGLWREEPVKR